MEQRPDDPHPPAFPAIRVSRLSDQVRSFLPFFFTLAADQPTCMALLADTIPSCQHRVASSCRRCSTVVRCRPPRRPQDDVVASQVTPPHGLTCGTTASPCGRRRGCEQHCAASIDVLQPAASFDVSEFSMAVRCRLLGGPKGRQQRHVELIDILQRTALA